MSILDGLDAEFTAGLSDVFYDAVLERDVAGTITDPADPPAPTTTTYICKALRDNYSTSQRSGGLVKIEDVNIIILQTTLDTVPKALDRITITGQGGPYTVVSDGDGQPAVSADPAGATWECRAR